MKTAEFSSLPNFKADGTKPVVDAASLCPKPSSIACEIHLVQFQELNPRDALNWERFRSSLPEFRTPFFSFAFARAVQEARGDVLVALFKQNGETVGYFPHHRVGTNIYPVGRRYNDAHGVIAEPGVDFTWSELLESVGAKGFEFHSLVGPDRDRMSLDSFAGTVGSFLTSLGNDSEVALKRIEQEHRTMFKQGQKTRKLAREIGELRLEVDCKSPSQLSAAIERKRDHYRRTNILDLFSTPWTQELIRNLSENSNDEAHVAP